LFVAGGGALWICLLGFPGRDREKRKKKKKKREGGRWLTGWLLLLCLFAVYWHWVARKEGRKERSWYGFCELGSEVAGDGVRKTEMFCGGVWWVSFWVKGFCGV